MKGKTPATGSLCKRFNPLFFGFICVHQILSAFNKLVSKVFNVFYSHTGAENPAPAIITD